MSPFIRPSLFTVFSVFFGTTSADNKFLFSATPTPQSLLVGRWTKADHVEIEFAADGDAGVKLTGIYPNDRAANIAADTAPVSLSSQTWPSDALHISFTWPPLNNGWPAWGSTTFALGQDKNLLLEKNQLVWRRNGRD